MRRRDTRGAPGGRPEPLVVFLAALLLALLAAGAQGVTYYRDQTPAAAVQATVGETVQTGGARLQVRSLTVAPTMPSQEKGDPPVTGPHGSLIVLVLWTQQIVDPSVPLGDHRCETSLVADDGSVWNDDTDFTEALRRPKSLECGSTESEPLRLGQVREIGSSYVIPARYGQSVHWRLSFDQGQHVVDFRR